MLEATPDSVPVTARSDGGLYARLAEVIARSTLPSRAADGESATWALEVLCDGYASTRMTLFGRLLVKGQLTESVTKYETLMHYLGARPEIAQTAITAPVFIVAPFRTGTTLLHRLLAEDSVFRWPRPWEVSYAPPRAPDLRGDPGYWSADERIARIQRALEMIWRKSPELARLHPVSPHEAEECFGLLETSLLSPSFAFHGGPTGYLDWLCSLPDERIDAAYRLYADQLRLLQWWSPGGGRWLLKSPMHLHGLGSLLEVFPDAKVIQIHRAPRACQLSFCRLLAANHKLSAATVDLRTVGSLAQTFMREALVRAVRARHRAAPERFLDLSFDDLALSPLACVRRIHEWLGLTLEGGTEARMERWLDRHPRDGAASGPTLEAFGLDPESVDADYAAYLAFRERA